MHIMCKHCGTLLHLNAFRHCNYRIAKISKYIKELGPSLLPNFLNVKKEIRICERLRRIFYGSKVICNIDLANHC